MDTITILAIFGAVASLVSVSYSILAIILKIRATTRLKNELQKRKEVKVLTDKNRSEMGKESDFEVTSQNLTSDEIEKLIEVMEETLSHLPEYERGLIYSGLYQSSKKGRKNYLNKILNEIK